MCGAVWSALGRVANYIDPFAGSYAMLLGRPRETWKSNDDPGTETANDLSNFLSNYHRAVKYAPDDVAEWATWPVSEVDLHARHRWLVDQLPDLAAKMLADPDYHDAKIAGWWVWGVSSWIGSGWCPENRGGAALSQQLPHLSTAGQGVNRKLSQRQIGELFAATSERLRGVRIACGDWRRVLSDSVTWRIGLTGIFADPPYSEGKQTYGAGGTGTSISAEFREWALVAGERSDVRIVLAGYDGEHNVLESHGWTVKKWKAKGGYAGQGSDPNVNATRERLWCSPHCLRETNDASVPIRVRVTDSGPLFK